MKKITFLLTILFVFTLSFSQAQTVDQIITDYEGYWVSGQGAINYNRPENSHNLLAFRFGTTTYSTGVDDAKLNQESVTFTAKNFRALPFNALPTSGASSYIALGQLFDGIDNGLNTSPTEPFEENLSGQELTQFLTNGIRGLNLGSGFANVPNNTFVFKLSANGIDLNANGDNVPDILVSQIANPSGGTDTIRLVNSSGNQVGDELSLDLGSSPNVGRWGADFYNLNSQAGLTNTRRGIRFRAFDISSFNANNADLSTVVAIEYDFSGTSDPAFIAYNEESISVARQLNVTVQPVESACDGTMVENFEVQVEDLTGTKVEQAGFAVTASIETGPGGLLGTVTQTTDANGIATFDDLQFEIGNFHTIRFENTSMEPGISSVIDLEEICSDSEWNGSVSTAWNNASNWTPNEIPNANFNVLIPSGVTNYPILQANAGAKDLTMEDNTSIDINGNVFAISGNITMGTNSTISGNASGSNLYFSGTAPQIIPDNFIVGDLDQLTIENAQGVTSNTNIVLTSLLRVINGDFNTNNSLTLACQFTPVRKTAQVGIVGVDGSINGNVTTEQCFPANRAFRLVSSSVNSATSIRENWQENPSSYTNDPNPGYGTHITGVSPGAANATLDQDGDNGFDYNPSGNASMFTFDNVARTWNSVPNTTDNLMAGQPYRLMIRGDRSINVQENETQPTNTKLSTTGDLTTGPFSYSASINTNANLLSIVGNPYHAQVDMKAVLSASTNINPRVFYVWDPTINTRGAYVTLAEVGGNWGNSNGSSSANRYLQPMQAAFIETNNLSSTPSLNFTEGQKKVNQIQTTVFSVNEERFIQMNLYKEDSYINGDKTLDGLKLFFDADFKEESEDDFSKLANDDENLARLNGSSYLSVELRPYPKTEEILPLFFNNYRHSNYILEFDLTDGLEGFSIFVNDNYLNEQTEITSNDDIYSFTVDESISESTASDRFSLVFEPISLSTVEETLVEASLYPNPTKGSFRISGANLGEDAKIEIYNMIGQQVYKTNLKNQSTTEITNFNGSAGVYLVKLKTNQGERTFKLIKQ